MDNLRIDVTAEGDKSLGHALAIVWGKHNKATHYKVLKLSSKTDYHQGKDGQGKDYISHYTRTVVGAEDGTPTLILLWHDEQNATPLPFPLTCAEAATQFVSEWLKHASRPDSFWKGGDVEHGNGFRVFTEAWGHVADHHYAIVGVQFAYALYGK